MQFKLLCFLLFILPFTLEGQRLNLDKKMKEVRNESGIFSCNLPGWSLRFVFNQLEEDYSDEMIILDQLLRHTKRLRLVIADATEGKTENRVDAIHSALHRSKQYENMIDGDASEAKFSLWTKQDGNKIKELFLSVLSHNEKTLLIKIKSDLPLKKLEELPFFKEAKS